MMKRWTQTALAVGLTLSVSACSGDSARPNDQKNTTAAREGSAATAGTSGTSASTANMDSEFVQEQLAMGQAEIELGQLAQQRGSNPKVKRFGEMMVRDHKMAGDELKQIASSANANRSAANDTTVRDTHSDHAEVREDLSKLSGRDFDKRYIDQMIEDHEKGISDVENKAERADNSQLRAWAAKTLPKMRQHLEEAKSIQEALKDEKGNSR
jgi:putative membrane protein